MQNAKCKMHTARHLVTLSPCHLVTPSLTPTLPSPARRGGFTPSPHHPVTLSPCHLVTLSPCHPVTLSPCHPVTLSLRHASPAECDVKFAQQRHEHGRDCKSKYHRDHQEWNQRGGRFNRPRLADEDIGHG